MSELSVMMAFKSWLPLLMSAVQDMDFDKVLSICASLVFIATFILQFFSIYRHGGRDAVVSMMTWVLVAGLCTALAGLYWQQQRDFFQVVLLLILAGGALSCFLISAMSRETLQQEVARRKGEAAGGVSALDSAIEDKAAAMRERLALARQRKVT